ncbi:MAG: hypothetical protein ACC656_09785 [Candidatus Heimdallarchaeota archaeon]
MAKQDSQEKVAKEFIQQYLGEEESAVSEVETTEATSKWQDLPLSYLPMGKLYHPGYRIEFRAAEVEEIQHFSTIENNNAYDIRNKLNDLLNACLRITLPNKKQGSYLDIKIGDRLYLIYTIRDITFQKGPMLTLPVKCSAKKCKHEFEIELVRQHIEMQPEDDKVWSFYNSQYQAFIFNSTLNENPIVITMPSIGIQESFRVWMEDKRYNEQQINDAYVKIAPYLINKSDLGIEGIEQFFERFNQIANEEFQFLNDVINKFKNQDFKLGIKGLMKKCPTCGMEVRTTKIFPDRASDIFIIPNAFERYLKK